MKAVLYGVTSIMINDRAHTSETQDLSGVVVIDKTYSFVFYIAAL